MATKFSLEIQASDDEAPKFYASKPNESYQSLINYLKKLSGGAKKGAVSVKGRTSLVSASGTVTCATVAAADTVTINGVAFTAVDADAGANEFLQTGTDAVDAAALAAAINASVTAGIAGVVTAAAEDDVVTITAVQPGKAGNAITLASSDGVTLAVSAARLAGGAETVVSFDAT